MKERLASGAREAIAPVLAADLMGSGFFRILPGDLAAAKRKPGPVPEGWSRTPPSLLRYSDEQTVVGTAAVFSAIEAMGVAPDRFEEWGVVAASRYLGRASLAGALRNFRAEGVWGISPHLIPHFALHAPSGTISLALGSHGPNLGVGGGINTITEGFLAAISWLTAGAAPGVWLVLTGWSPELIPDRKNATPFAGECQGLALALSARGAGGCRPWLRVVAGGKSSPKAVPTDLASLADSLASRRSPLPRPIAIDSSGCLRVELLECDREPGVTRNGQG